MDHEYRYNSLNLGSDAFRLLWLKAGFPDDVLRCEILEAFLGDDNLMPYKALSYVWGSVEEMHWIEADKKALPITRNLYEALNHIRSEEEDQFLWVDAICINQIDLQERGHQVRCMDRIYSKAERVIIWLGKATADSIPILNYLSLIETGFISRESGWIETMGDIRPEHREGYYHILDRPWFRRVWVIQEVASARSAIVRCGHQSVSTRTFSRFPSLAKLPMEDYAHCQAVLEVMPGPLRQKGWWSLQPDLRTLLAKFWQAEATIPADKVYALLNLVADVHGRGMIAPDYSLPLEVVLGQTLTFVHSPGNYSLCQSHYVAQGFETFMQNLYDPDAFFLETIEKGAVDFALALAASESFNITESLARNALLLAIRRKSPALLRRLLECQPIAFHKCMSDWDILFREAAAPLRTSDMAKGSVDPFLAASRYKHITPSTALQISDAKALISSSSEMFATMICAGICPELCQIEQLVLEENGNSSDEVERTDLNNDDTGVSKEMVASLLQQAHLNPNTRDAEGRTALTHSCALGNDRAVETLLHFESLDVNIRDHNHRTPLMYAAAIQSGVLEANAKKERIIDLLLSHDDIDVNAVDMYGFTALMFATRARDSDVISKLFKKHADVNLVDSKGRSALMLATESTNIEVLEHLLAHKDTQVNLEDEKGRTALLLASDNRNIQAIACLLRYMGNDTLNVNTKDSEGRNALMSASEWSAGAVKRLLACKDVEINSQDNQGHTALMNACAGGSPDVAELLLTCKSIEVNLQDNNGCTALINACEASPISVVELLLASKDTDVNMQDFWGRTALMKACHGGFPSIVERLLACDKLDVNKEDKNGRNALMYASLRWDGVIEHLIRHPLINVNARDATGRTALMWFVAANDTGPRSGLVKKTISPAQALLSNKSVDVNSVDGEGRSALMYAIEHRQWGCVKLLWDHKDCAGSKDQILDLAEASGSKSQVLREIERIATWNDSRMRSW